ncbi:DUF3231 family protein [Rossellomorea marisflavi]|uniref:DUF3231 family protein n=1 Tax=Rossellomorea marisflavi TaxID=189381 RepID=UPI0035157F64
MSTKDIQLTTAEIAALWTTYMKCTAMDCFYQHFLIHVEDDSIKDILVQHAEANATWIQQLTSIFEQEGFPVPKGFSSSDVDLTAPPLFTDIFVLSFVYRGGQVTNEHFTSLLETVARADVLAFFEASLGKSVNLYKSSLNLMLEKGVYDRPPKIPYPDHVGFVKENPSLIGQLLGENRPLNVLELSELFFIIERNCIGLVLLKGFLQVVKDREVSDYFRKGKKLSEKQITAFNKIIMEDDAFPTYPVTMEVTNSTESPFSDKLLVFFITSSNAVGLSTMCHAITMSTRKDLGVQFAMFVTEILKFGSTGLDLLVRRGWMEEPPQKKKNR